MITEQRKQELAAAGYTIEDMSQHGPEWEGQYRWLNDRVEGDGWGYPHCSEQEAWLAAGRHQKDYAEYVRKYLS